MEAFDPAEVVKLPRCLVTDLDRTLTGPDLVPDGRALRRIRELRSVGIRVVLATGRRFDDARVMGLLRLFDGVVAENGAVVCIPTENLTEVLHTDFSTIARAGLGDMAERFTWGRVVGSGPRDLTPLASQRLAQNRIAHAIEFNADDVMLLPVGVSKATGAEHCLRRMGMVAADAWAIGDGENDVSLLEWACVGAAPSNAAPAVRAAADVVLVASHSAAFMDFTDHILDRPQACDR